MRVLWVCNLILPIFAEWYGVKSNPFGGWMSGTLDAFSINTHIEIGVCVPVYDCEKKKNGIYNGFKVYAFSGQQDFGEYDEKYKREFEFIYNNFKPDIIHIWGTEYNHARSAFEACLDMGLLKKCIVDIQGLVSIYENHYEKGVEEEYLVKRDNKGKCIIDGKKDFQKRAENEIFILKKACFVSGRTQWDEICSKRVNKKIHYLECNRILRSEFYSERRVWEKSNVEKNTILVSQGSYPIKGLHYLIRSLPEIKDSFRDIKVIVCGEDPRKCDENGYISPYGRYICDLIKKNNCEEQIEFTGILDAHGIIEKYLSASVFLSPSNIENSSNSICEAMFLGMPVVASFVGGNASLIKHGKNGLLYQVDAEYMLAGYVCGLLQNTKLCNDISLNARKTALERHNKNMLGEKMYNNYREVLLGR